MSRARRMRGLRAVLAIDGAGVVLLGVGAAVSAPSRAGPAATTAVGAAGWALAAAAVARASRRSGDAGENAGGDSAGDSSHETGRLQNAERLVTAGFVLNTVGCLAVLVAFRHDAKSTAAARALLLGGSILSALYLRCLDALGDSDRRHPTVG